MTTTQSHTQKFEVGDIVSWKCLGSGPGGSHENVLGHIAARVIHVSSYGELNLEPTDWDTATEILRKECEWNDIAHMIAHGLQNVQPEDCTLVRGNAPVPGEEITVWPCGPGSIDTEPGLQPWKAEFVGTLDGEIVIRERAGEPRLRILKFGLLTRHPKSRKLTYK